MQETVLVATAGQGILRSSDRGQTWRRLDIEQDIEFDAVVRCVVPHPDNPATIYAGTETGLCVSEDAGVTWKQVETAMNGYHIWQLVIDARNPQRMFAGTGAPSRALMFRSMDGGANWEQLPPELPEFCMGVNRPRIVTIALDPNDASEVWFGVEETGAFRSRDNGDTWERVDGKDGGIGNSDIHSILILAGPPKTHMVLVVTELYVSKDDGETWKGFNARGTHSDCVIPASSRIRRVPTRSIWVSATAPRARPPGYCDHKISVTPGIICRYRLLPIPAPGRSQHIPQIPTVFFSAPSTATFTARITAVTAGGANGASSVRSPISPGFRSRPVNPRRRISEVMR